MNNLLGKKLNHSTIRLILLLVFIVIFNILMIGSVSNLALTIPQICYILYLLIKGQRDKAILWHFIFIITSISTTNISELLKDDAIVYNYARIKLVSNLTLSYVISTILLIVSSLKKRKMPKGMLFYKLYKLILVFAVLGTLLGIWGLAFKSYSVNDFIGYSVYIYVTLINILILLLNYKESLVANFYKMSVPVLSASVIGSFICYALFNVSTSYGGLDSIILSADTCYYGILLLLSIYATKFKYIVYASTALYIIMILNSSGGKGMIITGLGICLFIYYTFINREIYNKMRLFVQINRMIIILSLLFVLMMGVSINTGPLFQTKLSQVESLFFADKIQEIDTSPYVRVASLLNILYENITRPVNLLFGQGYGGYFTDQLGLFQGLDLTNGGWSENVVASGYFSSGHDTFVIVPLLNGFIGLFALYYIVFLYIKRLKTNHLAFAAIPWLFLTFYFNTQIAIAGMFFLFASEYKINRNQIQI